MSIKGIITYKEKQAQFNLQWAQSLIQGLVESGLQHVVISPGSRSTPLTLVCARHSELKTWVQVDERSAAFFALGLARATNQPVGIICTSGSAPAHWLPAVIEANHNLVPLVLLTANRPAELWGWGANQTIDQSQLFSGYIRSFYQLSLPEDDVHLLQYVQQAGRRAFSESQWPLPGPVHLDIPFREPFITEQTFASLPEPRKDNRISFLPHSMPDKDQIANIAEQLSSSRGIIIAGPETGTINHASALADLAEHLQVPVFADPLSGLRFGQHKLKPVITTYDAFLRDMDFADTHRPDWILRFGAMPVSKTLNEYMKACSNACHILIDPYSRWLDPLYQTTERIVGNARIVCEQLQKLNKVSTLSTWFGDFYQQEQQTRKRMKCACDESILVNDLIAALPDDSLLFSGNSMSIRNIDSFSTSANKKIGVLANRGVSGIDGNVSTLAGLAAIRNQTHAQGMVVGLIGDLACYHDMNGLLALREQDVLLIVINNGGGGIFHHLPQATLAEFKQFWQTPLGLDFEKVANLYDMAFYRVDNMSKFDSSFKQALNTTGARMLEVIIDPKLSHEKHLAYWELIK
ncbi:MAG: 2-succinyl-5-enolpyruvyl-6-hydroxy-3-cyclohexene-1-carboxylic-acid synthase [Gammaproteobacteria bacterium]|nr:2-succinyl-5-enolpyruvyl-6-hydroxy-3-cyclohexene-1-carboxylic-acid synthase [Gammaproteobacteria bacterium]